ncbi:MAG: type II secretion system F family protein, partial [Pedobacter sp.]
MAIYLFKGRNSEGRVVNGQVEAANIDTAAGQLLGRGITPVSMEEQLVQLSLGERFERATNLGKVEIVELIMFCRQMYTISKSGIPLVKG